VQRAQEDMAADRAGPLPAICVLFVSSAFEVACGTSICFCLLDIGLWISH